MTTKTALKVPADPQWRHVVAVTVLSAVRVIQDQFNRSEGQWDQAPKQELSQMGDVSLLLDRALDDLESLAGVTSIIVEVESVEDSAVVTFIGSGDELQPAAPPAASEAPLLDPLARSLSFAWQQSATTCSFRVPVRLPEAG